VEGAQVEFLFLTKPSVGEEFDDFEFADLISNRLTGR
jgi:hypothetical protein